MKLVIRSAIQTLLSTAIVVPFLSIGSAIATPTQISLNESGGSSNGIVGGTPVVYGTGATDYYNVPFDVTAQQTGPVFDVPAYTGDVYTNANGPADVQGLNTGIFITFHFSTPQKITAVQLFNGHDGSANDSGTANFEIIGSVNSAQYLGTDDGYFPTNASLLVSGTLQPSSGSTVAAQTFAVPNPQYYNYVAFEPETAVAGAQPSYYSLDQIRFFTGGVPGQTAPVPELPVPLMLSAGLLVPLLSRRMRAASTRAV